MSGLIKVDGKRRGRETSPFCIFWFNSSSKRQTAFRMRSDRRKYFCRWLASILLTYLGLSATRERNVNFGTSLMLANIVNSSGPNSPRLINASFAAIFDNNDISKEFVRKFSQLRFNIPESPGIVIALYECEWLVFPLVTSSIHLRRIFQPSHPTHTYTPTHQNFRLKNIQQISLKKIVPSRQ